MKFKMFNQFNKITIMKSLIIKNGIVLGLIFMIALGNAFAAEINKDLIGTWKYKAPSAPYEYSAGKIIFSESGDKIEGKLQIGSNQIDLRNVTVESNEVSCGVYVEDEYVKLKMTLKKNTFAGTASYSEGTLEVSGEKEK